MDRLALARVAAEKLSRSDPASIRAVLGFDGFIDEISDIVDKRQSPATYDKITTIERFGEKIMAAAGQSCNFERVVTRRKLGGNGLIMAHALATLGLSVTYIGAVGDAQNPAVPDPLFEELARKAALIPLGPPAVTHALEFSDGKLMLGDLAALGEITWERIMRVVGRERFRALCDQSMLLGMLNWTMLPHLTEIWQHAALEVFPYLSTRPHRRTLFIDLADPAKRPAGELRLALGILKQIDRAVDVTLGLNLSEARQVAGAVGLSSLSELALSELAARLRESLDLSCVVIHPRWGAAAATATTAAEFLGPFVQRPEISTGAGDHFNAGFALGQVLRFSLEESLCLGTAVSGHYVRRAATPTIGELIAFLKELPEPEAGCGFRDGL